MQLHNHRKILPLFLRINSGQKLFLIHEDNNERNLNYNFDATINLNIYTLPEEKDNKKVDGEFNYNKKADGEFNYNKKLGGEYYGLIKLDHKLDNNLKSKATCVVLDLVDEYFLKVNES